MRTPHQIALAQHDARERGALSIWTIYDHPSDFPHSFVARRFEVGPERSEHPLATCDIAQSENLDALRHSFGEAGLVCVSRAPEDDPNIVESWL
jgi:hypothetical protein